MDQTSRNNKTVPRLSRRSLALLVGGVLGAALIAWLVLVVGIFGGKTKKNDEKSDDSTAKLTEPAEVQPNVPEGMAVVYRATAEYKYTEGGKRVKIRDAKYDDFGRITEQNEYAEDGGLLTRYSYKYDETGKLFEETARNGSGEITSRYVTTYNENGVKLKRVEYRGESEEPSATVEYNEQGKIIAEREGSQYTLYTDDGEIYECSNGPGYYVKSVLTDDGRILEKTVAKEGYFTTISKYLYDVSTGELMECSAWTDGNLVIKTLYAGRTREKFQYGGEPYDPNTPIYSEKITYDEYGNILSEMGEGKYGVFRRIEYEYSADSARFGKCTKMEYYEADGSLSVYTTYKYSKAGQELAVSFYNADGVEQAAGSDPSGEYYGSYHWELDEFGNPVRRMYHLPGQEVVSEEYEYIPMVIPKEYMHEDEEHYVGIRYE